MMSMYKSMLMTKSVTIQIIFTPCRGVLLYLHDLRTIRLMQLRGAA
uniref:Uncharacterized protein n=1 Tax=Arundo donax TaxID=35708 RepID=A0A0A9BBM5_ARUDO